MKRRAVERLTDCWRLFRVFRASDSVSVSAALLSVYDKTGLLPLAQGLHELGFRLLGSGGTAKLIREANIPIECVRPWPTSCLPLVGLERA